MRTHRERWLAISVASCRIGYVFLIGGDLKDWQKSRAATCSPTTARSFIRLALENLKPDLVILENPDDSTRKRGKSLEILQALAQDLKVCGQAHILVSRTHGFANKYEEAKSLVHEHPYLKGWLPQKPKIWEREPADTLYFEALSMAIQARKNQPK